MKSLFSWCPSPFLLSTCQALSCSQMQAPLANVSCSLQQSPALRSHLLTHSTGELNFVTYRSSLLTHFVDTGVEARKTLRNVTRLRSRKRQSSDEKAGGPANSRMCCLLTKACSYYPACLASGAAWPPVGSFYRAAGNLISKLTDRPRVLKKKLLSKG